MMSISVALRYALPTNVLINATTSPDMVPVESARTGSADASAAIRNKDARSLAAALMTATSTFRRILSSPKVLKMVGHRSSITDRDEAKTRIRDREHERIAAEQHAYEQRVAERAAHERETGKKTGGKPPKPPSRGIDPLAQINLTDEESRIMPSKDGMIQAYNAQA